MYGAHEFRGLIERISWMGYIVKNLEGLDQN